MVTSRPDSVKLVVGLIGKHKSFDEIIDNLHSTYYLLSCVLYPGLTCAVAISGIPETVNRTYIDQSSYWLTYFPYVRCVYECLGVSLIS